MMVDDALPAKKEIKITADSRYKLYINGKFVQEGPQKPLDQKEWFVDTANAAPYLVPGANVVAVEVLRFAASALFTPIAASAFDQPRNRSSMKSPPITSVRAGICRSSAFCRCK